MADTSKYLLAARQALQENNFEDAQKYYEMVKIDDPTNVEAKVQYQYAKFGNCTNGQAYNCYNDYFNVVQHVVDNVASSDMPLDEQIAFLADVIPNITNAGEDCCTALDKIRREGDDTSSKEFRLRTANLIFAKTFGDAVEKKYASSTEGMKVACDAWKSYVNRANGSGFISKEDREKLPSYAEKIQKIDPSFTFVAKKKRCCF